MKMQLLILLLFSSSSLFGQDSLLMANDWCFTDTSKQEDFRIIDSLVLSTGKNIYQKKQICRNWNFRDGGEFIEKLLGIPDPMNESEIRSWKRTGIKPPTAREIIGYSQGNWFIENGILHVAVLSKEVRYSVKIRGDQVELVKLE